MAKTPKPNFDNAILGEIENHLSQVARSVADMRRGRLNEKALLIMISHASGQSQTVVKAVLGGMADLEKLFFNKRPA